MSQTLIFVISVLCLRCCDAREPAFQKQLDPEKVCKEDICKFHLSVRDEMSMTEKIYGQGRNPITKTGETFMVDISQEGHLLRDLGNFYNKPRYADMNRTRIQATDNVITANGLRRKIITINGVFPGPTLEVMEGAEVNLGEEYLKTVKKYKATVVLFFRLK